MKISVYLLLVIINSWIALGALTRTVDIDGAGQYTTIQAGINSAVAGDTVLVYPGRYLENVTIRTSNISLISLEYYNHNPAYIDSTIIDGNAAGRCIRVNTNTQNVHIRGFSIVHGFVNGLGGGLIFFNNSIGCITNCSVSENVSSSGAGLAITGSTVFLSKVDIYDNQGGGVYITGNSVPVSVTFDSVNRCSIYNNTSSIGSDIYASSLSSDLNVYLNTFTISIPTNYYAYFNNSYGNDYHFIFDIQNADHEEINHDLYVSPDGNDANDGLSPQSALKTIHTAVYRIAADSLNQKTVHILPGTYSRTANQQIFPITLKSWVKVVGSGMDNTLVIGEPNPLWQNETVAVFRAYSQIHVSLSGMSISTVNTNNSSALISDKNNYLHLANLHIYDISPDDAAVIHIGSSRNNVWENITIENFTTTGLGFIDSETSFQGIIRNCTFRNGTSTFVSDDVWAYPLFWMTVDGDITFENCIFDQITMSDDDSQAIMVGGMQFPAQTNHIRLVNCLFTNFDCQNEMIVLASGNFPLMDIMNCTFADNNGDNYTLQMNGTVNVVNSIFYNNTPDEISIYPRTGEHTDLTIDSTCLRNGQNGVSISGSGNSIVYSDTNISSPPLFGGGVTTDPLRYSLAADSPCINAGVADTTGLGLPIMDLAGNYRVWNNRIDMGCFEYDSEPVGAEDNENPPAAEIVSLVAYPNPFKHFTTIKYNLGLKQDSHLRRNDGIVDLSIYNIKGQKIKTIKSKSQIKKDAGENQVAYWDGRDKSGKSCSSGIYLLKLTLNGKPVCSRKVTLVK